MTSSPITIGMLPGWPVYGSIFLDRFLQYIISGVRAAARDQQVNLMVACGISRAPGMRSLHTAWPVLSSDCDYVPLGHWNTDGLIVTSPLRSEERNQYLRKVVAEGFPVVFIGSGEGTPAIVMDNEDGIHQAVEHLVRHGHRRIAFIAGDPLDHGDSMVRLQAYRNAVEEFDAVSDPRLVAYGYHYREGGRKAMEQILATGIPFTAVAASNDVSAFGAMEMLKSAGRRIPMDVAVIGFDDQPAAAGQIPPLTTVHYPLFDAGVLAVNTLLERIARSGASDPQEIRIPAWLSIRESCGCSPSYQVDRPGIRSRDVRADTGIDQIANAVGDALESGFVGKNPKNLSGRCKELVTSFLQGAESGSSQEFHRVLEEILAMADSGEDHGDMWQAMISVLRLQTAELVPAGQSTQAENLLHQARLAITDHAERQSLRRRLSISEINHQIGWMTTRMFSAGTVEEILHVFAVHLAQIGISFAQVALFEPRQGNPLGGFTFYENLWRADGGQSPDDLRALSAETPRFPVPEMLPADTPYTLALLPIVFQDLPIGFAVFDAGNLEPLATVVRQLAAAVKTRELQVRADELSLTDPVTGIQNRRFFELFLQRETERCRRYRRGMSLMLVSLGGWQAYASAQGPAKSRDALRSLAECITVCVRRGSDVVCRFAGDTFAVLLPETTLSGARAIAETIRRSIEGRKSFHHVFDVGIGIAVAETEQDLADAADLIAAAQQALNRARNSGGNQTDVVQMNSSAPDDGETEA